MNQHSRTPMPGYVVIPEVKSPSTTVLGADPGNLADQLPPHFSSAFTPSVAEPDPLQSEQTPVLEATYGVSF